MRGLPSLKSAASALLALVGIAMFAMPYPAFSADKDVKQIERDIKQLRAQERAEREQNEARIKALEAELKKVEDANKKLQAAQAEANDTIKDIQQTQEAGPTTAQLSEVFGKYLGSHMFDVTGAAGFSYNWDQQNAAIDGFHHQSENAFFFDMEPMLLYRPTDWILFEGVMSFTAGATGTAADLSSALFHAEVSDYYEIVAGLFDNPFGDWWEAQSPMWVNRFATAPLSHGVEAVTPPAELGIQIRGGVQWGALGQDVDYTVWTGNGPSFSEPVLGASLSGPVNPADKLTNGVAMAGRIRVYPLPLDAEMGRLELGASTYNAKWLNDQWYNAWGVDFNYFIGNLETRGEWIEAYRQMGTGLPTDNRQGWFVQIGYMLSGYSVPFLPAQLNTYIQRLEPLVRYSGVNQHFVAIDDVTGAFNGGMRVGFIPDFGFNASPALFAPHSREVAVGLDYYISPSIVWQNELDFELPRSGGLFVAGPGAPVPGATTPVGAVPNDRAFISQFTIGF